MSSQSNSIICIFMTWLKEACVKCAEDKLPLSPVMSFFENIKVIRLSAQGSFIKSASYHDFCRFHWRKYCKWHKNTMNFTKLSRAEQSCNFHSANIYSCFLLQTRNPKLVSRLFNVSWFLGIFMTAYFRYDWFITFPMGLCFLCVFSTYHKLTRSISVNFFFRLTYFSKIANERKTRLAKNHKTCWHRIISLNTFI